MAKQQVSKPQIKTGTARDERRGAKSPAPKPPSKKLPPPRSRGKKRWLLVVILAIVGWRMWASGEDTLRERHAGVLSKAEALRLPVNMSSEELEALERVGPLLDSVGVEMGGMNEPTEKI